MVVAQSPTIRTPWQGRDIRADFPILSRLIHGKPLTYLDSAATSQKPRQVIDAMVEYFSIYNANIHRGVYTIAEEATARYEESRKKIAAFIGAASLQGSDLRAQHHRGDQPGGLLLGLAQPETRR